MRLYTGPMYVPYLKVLRGQVFFFVTSLLTNVHTGRRRWNSALSNVKNQTEAGSNLYTATIHCINSGLRKLCRVQVEKGLKLYRGFGDMSLTSEFDADTQGHLGVVELGLMLNRVLCRREGQGVADALRGRGKQDGYWLESVSSPSLSRKRSIFSCVSAYGTL